MRVDSSALGTSVNPLVLENTPPVLSIGQRVIHDNWKFEWTQSAGPVFTKPDGATIQMSVKNFVPIIVEDTTALVVEASATPSQWEDESSTTLSDNWSSRATKAPSDEGPRSILKSVSRLGNILPYFGPAGNREPQQPQPQPPHSPHGSASSSSSSGGSRHRARSRPRAASPAAPAAAAQPAVPVTAPAPTADNVNDQL